MIVFRAGLWVGAAVALAVAAGCGNGGDEAGPGPSSATPPVDTIVFASSRDGDFDIYAMKPDGTSVTNLTRNAGGGEVEADDDSPAWSPNGSWIAFTSTRDHEGDGLGSSEIYVMGADGSSQRRLTENRLPDFAPRWLPDGRVAFVTCRDALSTCRLVARSLDSDDVATITTDRDLVFAVPSPDGTRVAFRRPAPSSWFDHPPGDLYVAGADGSDAVRVTHTPDAYESSVAWSPDGTRLAFTSDLDRNGPCLFHDCVGFASEIYVIDADGGDARRLTEFPGNDGFPVWSPDGEQILFGRIRDDSDDWELYVMNDDGSCQTRLTDNESWDWSPAWRGAGTGPRSC